jgi:hypothetical protein
MERGGVAAAGGLDARGGRDGREHALGQRRPDRLEQRLAPGRREPAADTERSRIAGRDERRRGEADRRERVVEDPARPLVPRGGGQQRRGCRPRAPGCRVAVEDPAPGAVRLGAPELPAAAGQAARPEAEVAHLAGVCARTAGDVPVHGEPAGDSRSRLEQREGAATRLADRRGHEVVREHGRRRNLGRDERDERRVLQRQVRGVAHHAAVGVHEARDRQAPGARPGLAVNAHELSNEPVEIAGDGLLRLLGDAVVVDEPALDRASADVDGEEPLSGQA